MYTNIYDWYRSIRRREDRANTAELKHKAKVMVDCARAILFSQTLTSVNRFRKAENTWRAAHLGSTKCFADEFECAIRSKRYYFEPSPFDSSFHTYHSPDHGSIYCAKSPSLPNQLKIGFCSRMTLKQRLSKMPARHGIEAPYPIFSITINSPAELERQIKENLREFRVSVNTVIRSNEYYEVTAIEVARRVVSTIKRSELVVSEVVLFRVWPNLSRISKELGRLGLEIDYQKWD